VLDETKGNSVDQLVDLVIDDGLSKYLSDSDTIGQLIDWLHHETGIKKMYLTPMMKVICRGIVLASRKGTKLGAELVVVRLRRLIEKVPKFDQFAAWMISLKNRLDANTSDRQLLEKILAGDRPERSDYFGASLTNDTKATIEVLYELDEFRQSVEEKFDKLLSIVTPQPILESKLPETGKSHAHTGVYRFRFEQQRVPFVGRHRELANLREFLNDPRMFLWWIVTGPGGSGKSRLALEFLFRNHFGWRCGFLPQSEETCFHEWRRWQPQDPTLIVADYASTCHEYLQKAIVALRSQTQELRQPVRLLLIEREASGPWWDHFLGSGEEQYALDATGFRDPLRLQPMSREEAWKQISLIMGDEPTTPVKRKKILKTLERIDSERCPLIIALVAEAARSDSGIEKWEVKNRDELLKIILRREQDKFWTTSDKESDRRYMNLLALSTTVGGLPLEALRGDWNIELPSTEEFDPDRYGTMSGQRSNELIAPLEPDILGEFFVLEHIKPRSRATNQPADRFRKAAYTLKTEFIDFLNRATQDFPKHISIDLLVSRAGLEPDQLDSWSFAANWYIHHCDDPTKTVSLANELIKAAHELPDVVIIGFNASMAAARAAGNLAHNGDSEGATNILAEIFQCCRSYPENRPLQAGFTIGLIKCICEHHMHLDLQKTKVFLDYVWEGESPKVLEGLQLHLELAIALNACTFHFGQRKYWPEAEDCLLKLKKLATVFKRDVDIQVNYADALSSMVLAYWDARNMTRAWKIYKKLSGVKEKVLNKSEVFRLLNEAIEEAQRT
jgi:hypothetical protein